MHSHERDMLELDYTRLRIGAVNSTIAWRYSSLTCQPSVFTVEGYVSREMALNLSTSSVRPILALNSTSTELVIPTSIIEPHITSGALFFRLLAFNQSGTQCASDSSVLYYWLENKSELKIKIVIVQLIISLYMTTSLQNLSLNCWETMGILM